MPPRHFYVAVASHELKDPTLAGAAQVHARLKLVAEGAVSELCLPPADLVTVLASSTQRICVSCSTRDSLDAAGACLEALPLHTHYLVRNVHASRLCQGQVLA